MDKTIDFIRYFPGAICLVSMDEEESLLYVNENLASMAGFSSSRDLLAQVPRLSDLVYPDDYISLRSLFKSYGGEIELPVLFRVRKSDGKPLRFNGTVNECENPLNPGEKCWAFFLSHTSFKEFFSDQDPLTGLLKTDAFFRKTTHIYETNKKNGTYGSWIAIYINLTNFEFYNAHHGVDAGNKVLRHLGKLLSEAFPNSITGHLGADKFGILTPRAPVGKKLEDIAASMDSFIGDSSVTMKAGIFEDYMDREEKMGKNSRHTFDLARLACISIRSEAGRVWALYDESMGHRLEDKAYVLRNFEKALENHWIKVYYQPVVRTLTGKVCSLEALSRWDDPERGLLPPSLFVPVLEEAGLIPKLDFYVIHETARHLRRLLEERRPVLPVSVNLSRIDFDRGHPLKQVEEIVRTFRLQKSWLRMEITESALTRDNGHLKEEIEKFHRAGYRCWLDDFGSGYSSLNVLQDFHFDELKLDMNFMKDFSPQTEKILRSLILMAKSLSIHTLAEGVETKEQAGFLRSLGCEKIQGYYVGKPMPYEALVDHCRKKGLLFETSAEEEIFEKAGHINMLTDAPAAIFLQEGRNRTILLMNPAFRKNLSLIPGAPLSEGPVSLSHFPESPRLASLFEKALQSGGKESMTFAADGKYLKLNLSIASAGENISIGRAELYNITYDEDTRESRRLDKIFRSMLFLYDNIYYYDRSENRLEVISSTFPRHKAGSIYPFREILTLETYIHPRDRKELKRFLDPAILSRRVRAEGVVSGLFRFRESDGSYFWKALDAVNAGPEGKDAFLLCIRSTSLRDAANTPALLARIRSLLPEELKENTEKTIPDRFPLLDILKNMSGINFFWKDKDRRFLGASRGFLEYYGIEDESFLLGKTDEDMGWHVDNEPFRRIEEKVISEGYISEKAEGTCIIRGRVHRIRASKYPIYLSGRIVGLLGFFEDLDKEVDTESIDKKLGLLSRETGLLTYRGMMMTILDYEENIRRNGGDFLSILLQVDGFEEVSRRYGEETAETLTKKLASLIEEHFPIDTTLTVPAEGCFALFLENRDNKEIISRLEILSADMYSLQEIEGRPITLHLRYALARGSEAGNPDELIELLSRRLKETEGVSG